MLGRFIFFGLLIVAVPAVGAGSPRPNIIVILSDDMGFTDLGCYGGEIATPNIDALAASGLRFSQFYNTSRCCPTRASLLTGLYSHQAGIGQMVNDLGHDAYRGDLNRRCVTLAEVVRPTGYRTFMVGKWHVTKQVAQQGSMDGWPLQRGFDRFYGTLSGAGNYFDPMSLVRDNTLISPFDDPEYRPETYYYTDAISDHAVRFIREHAEADAGSPFLMYVAYTAPHWPLHAKPADIAKYDGRYDEGYDPIRKARFEQAVKAGVIDGGQTVAPTAGQWDAVKDKQWESAGMEVYAAMVDSMDQGIGRIVSELQKQGQFENTLILYMHDNGGCHETNGRSARKGHPDGPRPAEPTFPPVSPKAVLERTYFPLQTRDGFPMRMGPHVMPGPGDTFLAYGRNWANVSNTPFREYKHWVHEGGISTPLVVSWPTGIDPALAGSVVHDVGHLIDLMPTVVDVANAEYPKERDGVSIQSMEGVSLLPTFKGKILERRAPLFWEHVGNKAVRDGNWKLVAKHGQAWELYDLAVDRAESHDRSKGEPAIAARLAELWQAWAERVGVEPFPVKGPAAKAKGHLFILSGQSNMTGGLEQGFADTVRQALGEDQMTIVRSIRSGRGIRFWVEDYTLPEDHELHGMLQAGNGEEYPRLLQAVKQAGDVHAFETVTFIWMQGESDAERHLGVAYERSFKTLLARLEKDLGIGRMHFVIGRISDHGLYGEKAEGWKEVRAIQQKLADDDQLGTWIDTDDLNGGDEKKPEGDLHYPPQESIRLGERFGEAALKQLQAKLRERRGAGRRDPRIRGERP